MGMLVGDWGETYLFQSVFASIDMDTTETESPNLEQSSTRGTIKALFSGLGLFHFLQNVSKNLGKINDVKNTDQSQPTNPSITMGMLVGDGGETYLGVVFFHVLLGMHFNFMDKTILGRIPIFLEIERFMFFLGVARVSLALEWTL